MHSEALEDLFVQELEELYDAEKQILKGLGAMTKAANHKDLKAAFSNHAKETKQQIERLERSFRILGERPSRGKASGVAGLIRQSKELAAHDSFDRSVADAGLITNGQKIEHYEIAAYGCTRTHAGILGYEEIQNLLAESLKEEEAADKLLTQIAEDSVNRDAAAAPYSQARTAPRRYAGTVEGSSGRKHFTLKNLVFGLAIGGVLSALFTSRPGQAQHCGRGLPES
jgi:ferritin-like metal-binding protein YciE